jgi:hypothetical protein
LRFERKLGGAVARDWRDEGGGVFGHSRDVLEEIYIYEADALRSWTNTAE